MVARDRTSRSPPCYGRRSFDDAVLLVGSPRLRRLLATPPSCFFPSFVFYPTTLHSPLSAKLGSLFLVVVGCFHWLRGSKLRQFFFLMLCSLGSEAFSSGRMAGDLFPVVPKCPLFPDVRSLRPRPQTDRARILCAFFPPFDLSTDCKPGLHAVFQFRRVRC